ANARPYNLFFMQKDDSSGGDAWTESRDTFLHSYFGRLAVFADGWTSSGGRPKFLENLRLALTEVGGARGSTLFEWGRALVFCHPDILQGDTSSGGPQPKRDQRLLRRRLWREAAAAESAEAFYLYTAANPWHEATVDLVPVTKQQQRWTSWKA